MYTEDEWWKWGKRDYSEDKHELEPEDQAHMDSIKQEKLDACAKQQSRVK